MPLGVFDSSKPCEADPGQVEVEALDDGIESAMSIRTR